MTSLFKMAALTGFVAANAMFISGVDRRRAMSIVVVVVMAGYSRPWLEQVWMVVGCEYGDRVSWCRSYGSLDCTDPVLRRDCCLTCSLSLPYYDPRSTSIRVTLTASVRSNTPTTWPSHTAVGYSSCLRGDGAMFCDTIPTELCYHFSRLCCKRCAKHHTAIPGYFTVQTTAIC